MAGAEDKTVLLLGPTEFLGRAILKHLFREGWRIYALTHPDERPAIEAAGSRLVREHGASGGELRILWGDGTSAGAGLDSRTIDSISREVRYIFHCPAMQLGERERFHAVTESIVKGTDQIISLAHRFPNLAILVHVSSTFVSGNYPGRFYEDWLDVGQSFYDPINKNHFIAETKLRSAARSIPIVVLRCGYLVGDAETGECDETRGLVPFFKLLTKYTRLIPRPLPLVAPDTEEKIFSLTPNDYCAKAAAALMTDGESVGKTFCLVDPSSPTIRTFVDTLSDLAGRTCYRVPLDFLGRLPFYEPMYMVEGAGFLAEKLKSSSFALRFLFQRGDYDTTNTKQALAEKGLACTPFSDYIERLYRYYLTRHA